MLILLHTTSEPFSFGAPLICTVHILSTNIQHINPTEQHSTMIPVREVFSFKRKENLRCALKRLCYAGRLVNEIL